MTYSSEYISSLIGLHLLPFVPYCPYYVTLPFKRSSAEGRTCPHFHFPGVNICL